ncbi:ATP-binding cassette domain-containing protein, partial [Halorubrum sp. SS7]
GVTCRYGRGEDNAESEGATAAVDEVSLAVPDGEFLVVAGANGSGKTTLVRTFNGLVEPDAGHVSVNGTPVEE